MNKPNPATVIFALGCAAVLSVSGCAATDQNLGQAVPAAIEGQRGQVHEWAIENNAAAILSLRGGDARIDSEDENGNTPLHWAATLGNADAADALLARGADANARSKSDLSAVSDEAMSLLIDKGVYSPEELKDVIVRNAGGTALHAAAASNNRDVVAAILEAGADVFSRNALGQSPLHSAAQYNAEKSAYELILHGAAVNARDNEGDTPMHNAAVFGGPAVMHELAVGGADINARDADAATPLHLAVFSEKLAAITVLVSRGANLEARAVNGFTPLILAAGAKIHPIVVANLVRAGANVNARADAGHTVLHLAADNNDDKAIEGFCNVGANADIWDVNGNTPLHYAAAKNFTESIRVLVGACKADVNSENRFSQTPLDLAVDEDNQAAIAELQKHNAQRGPKS